MSCSAEVIYIKMTSPTYHLQMHKQAIRGTRVVEHWPMNSYSVPDCWKREPCLVIVHA